MPRLEHFRTATLILVCVFLFGANDASAQNFSKDATTWWPDPSTGLMWTGQIIWGKNWQQATDYCAALKLGGYADWRLPTLDEMKAVTEFRHIDPGSPGRNPFAGSAVRNTDAFRDMESQPYVGLYLKGNISAPDSYRIWTSTLIGTDSAWTMTPGENLHLASIQFSHFKKSELTAHYYTSVLCTRPMEPYILQIAKDAQVPGPVSDMVTLKAYVPLHKARLAYQAGQFQESITQAQNALAIKPDYPYAYWAIGISYGRLGQWDQATTNLDAALKIDKNYDSAKTSLKWVKDSKEAAQKGKNPKTQPPQWN